MAWELTGNAGTNPATNFLGTTDNEPLLIKTHGVEQLRIDPVGNVNMGTYDSAIPYPQLTVTGPNATVNVETTEILRVMRHGVGGVKNQNSAGLFVGAFEPGENGRSRLDINVAGTPGPSNTWGSVPDVTVMTLQSNGSVGIGTTNPDPHSALEVSATPGTRMHGVRSVVGGSGSFGPLGIISVVREMTDAGAAVHAVNLTANTLARLCSGLTAGYFNGDVQVTGSVLKAGGGFRIDHPLDPDSKYLTHSFVESPDMKNVYDGVAILDAKGEAVVTLPVWFEAINKDFRYQLTAIGGAAPSLHIAQELTNNHFKIAGGSPGLKISWQVTGIRNDAWAKANRIQVEQDKPDNERGHYLHPHLQEENKESRVCSENQYCLP
jgi:hypothetical protein